MDTTPSLRTDLPLKADAERTPDVPSHVHAEVMIEQIASLTARLQDLEAAEMRPERRAEMANVRAALSALRFQFDPYQRDEVMAMVLRVDRYTSALNLQAVCSARNRR